MSTEVDEAVSVVLRELEYLGDAKQKITQLEEVVARLRQDVRLNENARILNMRILAQHQAAAETQSNMSAEVEKLRKEVDRLNHLLGEEKSQSEKYRTDVDSWRTQAQTSQSELEELRGKLKKLLADQRYGENWLELGPPSYNTSLFERH
ncbi:Fc.00g115610.m01.CDS01 [Cosmosporella sp. VM-42]